MTTNALSKRFFFRTSKITVDCVEENQMKYDIISSSYEGIKIKCALKVKCTYAKLNAKLRHVMRGVFNEKKKPKIKTHK